MLARCVALRPGFDFVFGGLSEIRVPGERGFVRAPECACVFLQILSGAKRAQDFLPSRSISPSKVVEVTIPAGGIERGVLRATAHN